MIKRKLNVYLGDLGHHTVTLTNNTVPLNIGYLAAYAGKHFGNELEFSLFKKPEELINAIEARTPDLLGLSHYVWNRSVSDHIFRFYKAIKKDGITLWGGPNFTENEPHKSETFMRNRPHVDFIVPFEGELPFYNIIQATLSKGVSSLALRNAEISSIQGVCYIDSDGRYLNSDGLRIEDLDSIPSPFLGGFLDRFLAIELNPIIETQRGCPFKCAYCHTSANYYRKVRHFNIERLREEIRYITKKLPNPAATSLVIADTNYGMYENDEKFAEFLETVYKETGFPFGIDTATGKTSHEKIVKTVMKCTKLSLNMGIQSLDDLVLKEIERTNIPFGNLKKFHSEMSVAKKISSPEIILGLPLETKQSHLKTLSLLLNELRPSMITQYTTMLLPGTKLYTEKSRNSYRLLNKFRIIPSGFGEYNNERCFEIEEVCVSTKDLSFDDYLEMRALYFFVTNVYGNSIFNLIIRALFYFEIDVVDFLMSLVRRIPRWDVFSEYLANTKDELFENEDLLKKYYKNNSNYEKLKRGEIGVNLSHVYRTRVLLLIRDFSDLLLTEFKSYLRQNIAKVDNSEYERFHRMISQHVTILSMIQSDFIKGIGIPTRDKPVFCDFEFDIIETLNTTDKSEISRSPVRYIYFMDDSSKIAFESLKKLPLPIQKAVAILRGAPEVIFPLYEKVGCLSQT